MEPPCFNNKQWTWKKRQFYPQQLVHIAGGCILILQVVKTNTNRKQVDL